MAAIPFPVLPVAERVIATNAKERGAAPTAAEGTSIINNPVLNQITKRPETVFLFLRQGMRKRPPCVPQYLIGYASVFVTVWYILAIVKLHCI